MSYSKVIEIDCPKCKTKQKFNIWQSVNVTEDFNLRDRVFDGDIFTFTCNECKAKAFIAYPMIYHDYERKFFIYFNPDNNFENVIETEGYITKKTDDYLEMLEMVKIFEDEVIDKDIEVAKEKLINKLSLASSDVLKGIKKVYYSGSTKEKVSFYIPQIKSKIETEW